MFPSPAATRTIQRDCNKESTMISESATILIVEDEQDIRELLAAVWGYQFEGYARTVDTHIRRLRNKLGDAAEIIETVRGVGYRCKE